MFGQIRAVAFLLIGGCTLISGLWVGTSELTLGLFLGHWHFVTFGEMKPTDFHPHSGIAQMVMDIFLATPVVPAEIIVGSLLLRTGIMQLLASD
jgi:hypothetical protein